MLISRWKNRENLAPKLNFLNFQWKWAKFLLEVLCLSILRHITNIILAFNLFYLVLVKKIKMWVCLYLAKTLWTAPFTMVLRHSAERKSAESLIPYWQCADVAIRIVGEPCKGSCWLNCLKSFSLMMYYTGGPRYSRSFYLRFCLFAVY